VHGTSAITAITAQNTLAVTAVHEVPADMVLAQVRAVLADIRVDAVKVGMLGTVAVVMAVARALDELKPGTPVVVDPVMVAESGARLLEPDAQDALVREILPRASVLTPNLPEARMLVGRVPAQAKESPQAGDEEAEAQALARAVAALGPRVVVLTGGHREQAVDLFLDVSDGELVRIEGARYADGAAHGSGCTHSSLLAAHLALGRSALQAATAARVLAGYAVAQGLRDVGSGPGPVDVLGLTRMRTD
jgi:hydroxymethylpyrimidine/phosphomethylpyrimidine kinase